MKKYLDILNLEFDLRNKKFSRNIISVIDADVIKIFSIEKGQ